MMAYVPVYLMSSSICHLAVTGTGTSSLLSAHEPCQGHGTLS